MATETTGARDGWEQWTTVPRRAGSGGGGCRGRPCRAGRWWRASWRGPCRSHTADFIVTNLNDSGAGSLRQAILDANAAGTVDTITFQAGLTGTIQLGAEFDISDDVTITGPGAAAITVDAQGDSQGLRRVQPGRPHRRHHQRTHRHRRQ